MASSDSRMRLAMGGTVGVVHAETRTLPEQDRQVRGTGKVYVGTVEVEEMDKLFL